MLALLFVEFVYFDTYSIQYLKFLIGTPDSDVVSILLQCWSIILLLFELMYEVLFSFAKAAYFCFFLQSVEKRFFTALSVLHRKHCIKY